MPPLACQYRQHKMAAFERLGERAAKAIPLISDTDRAETSGRDRADCGGTVFLSRLFGECRYLFFRLSLFLRKGHPFANDFSARLLVFHVRDPLGYLIP